MGGRDAALWALGWTVTKLGGISVDDQFTIYGGYGAITFSALSGLLLHHLPYPATQRGVAAAVGPLGWVTAIRELSGCGP